MPAPGDVDIVIASELMEAGRSILRGLVTPDRTTLIASTHRLYAVAEKEMPGDGIADPHAVVEAAGVAAKRVIAFDMEAVANKNGSVISACCSELWRRPPPCPFAAKASKPSSNPAAAASTSSLNAFRAAHDRAAQPPAAKRPALNSRQALSPLPASAGHPDLDRLLARVRKFPAPLHDMLFAGVKHLVDFQDPAYANEYLDRARPVSTT